MKILLVEDHNATAEALTKLLKRAEANLEIFHVKTLKEGLLKSVELEADITLLDLCLPDSPNWRDTAKAIEKFHPPVVVISAMVDAEVIAECHRHGVDDVFSKAEALRMISVLLRSMSAARLRRVGSEQRKTNEQGR